MAYVVANYDITNPEAYGPYGPAVMPTIQKYGGQVVMGEKDSLVVEGDASTIGKVTIIIKFESKDQAQAWYNSEEYKAVKGLRTDNSKTRLMVMGEAFPCK